MSALAERPFDVGHEIFHGVHVPLHESGHSGRFAADHSAVLEYLPEQWLAYGLQVDQVHGATSGDGEVGSQLPVTEPRMVADARWGLPRCWLGSVVLQMRYKRLHLHK